MTYVLVEHNAATGELDNLTAELISAAQVLGPVTAVVVTEAGEDAASLANSYAAALAGMGAAQIVAATSPSPRLLLPAVDALAALAAASPAPVVLAAGPRGNEIAGRLAARLAAGVLTDVVAIQAGGSATHSLFGGTVRTTAVAGGASPIYTLRPGAHKPAATPTATIPQVTPLQLGGPSTLDCNVLAFRPAVRGGRPELQSAAVVVAGGRGVGETGFATYVEPLADALGAAVGATRDAVDSGYVDGSAQIGQTGVTVSPDLYIGLGISGAIQHKSGMQTATKIVAINHDEDAPIFEIADLGIVAEVEEIVPEVLRLLGEN